ncbi:PilC/PilY family type IV pilus protein [Luteimonas sp. RD2P54]|uniref:PilC/PilY family type IV pilus protein n=1 Tax=Luteimonas endophytica TaxID=3042023 RepID=A0ABT6JAH4_9GAMM|nr:PilC/PilY family type IV pilus protein [Luteimonas endophytica]MDH5823825.1 PilC/PilY family type IV pilus protein [Luteimonas endophytica]
MPSRRIKTIFAAITLAAAGGAGYFLYGLIAAQGQGVLAQAPLNTQVQVPASFIMALDDSGSMNWETLNNTRDGVFVWRNNSFFNSSSVAWGYGNVNSDAYRYLMLFPYPGRNNYQNSIPPLDVFGFARSPDFNPAYFDPRVSYEPWKNADRSDYSDIDPAAAPVDPRPAGVNNKINRTFDLTRPVREHGGNTAGGNQWGFRVHSGMVLPQGLVYYRPNNYCGNIPGPNGEWHTLASEVTVASITNTGNAITGNNCRLGIEYFPATFYLKTGTLPGYTAEPVEVPDAHGLAAGERLYRYEIKLENYASPELYDEAIQNFANWFTYYRTRRESLVAGLTNALLSVNDMSIGWFRINNRNDVVMRDMGNETAKAALYSDFHRLIANGSTPSRQAVNHLGAQFKRTGDGAPIQLSCQKNAGMLFTDGYINDSGSPNVGGNLDGTRMPTAPFADSVGNTMADIVVPYYLDSLRPDIEANNVPVPESCDVTDPDPRLDCQTNLHMNFYGVTLGTLGHMYGVDYVPNPATPWTVTPDPFSSSPSWHTARVDMNPHAVDEMWHATLNARGEMINATTPAAISAAMRRILAAVASGASPSGTIGLTGARIGDGSLTVVPRYEARNEGTDWFSTLTAQQVSIDPVTREAVFSTAWEASDKLGPGSRNVWFADGAGTRRFNAANVALPDLCDKPGDLYPGIARCSAGEISALGVDIAGVIDYLLAGDSLERERGGTLRDRSTPLGDIVNSTPVISSPTDDYGYRLLGGTIASEYGDYLVKKRSRRYMVYVGANAGMLHAFDGGMNADQEMDAAAGGEERFGYIPATALGHMGNLLFPYDPASQGDQKFTHRYYVDGPITVSDARDSSNNWRTVLVGTAGAGGRSVFALDVSDPAGFNASSRLWEVSDLDLSLAQDVRENIGHVLGKPVVVPVKTVPGGDVRWVAVFGNGYNSASGKAVLFVVDIDSGTPEITMIEATEAGSSIAGTNGLGNVVIVDRWGGNDLNSGIRDGFADTVYAADQKGALWKFDLRAAAPASPVRPLFVTDEYTEGGQNYRQPITGGMTAAVGPRGGVMLYFGTGSFSFHGDPADRSLQSLYAINDVERGPTSQTLSRSHLLGQSVETEDGVRILSVNATVPVSPLGWFIDLPAGERFVGNPRIASGVIFMPTYAPEAETAGCSASGFNWLFGLNARSGTAGLSNVRVGSPDGDSPGQGTAAIQLATGGSAPVRDVAVNVVPRLAPATPDDPTAPGAPPSPAERQCWMAVTVAGLADPLYLPYPCGRQSWRQIE